MICTSLKLFPYAVPNINQWEWVSLNNRRYDVLLARLRSGCVDLNNYLSTIKIRDNPFCDYCANDRETVEYYALHFQKYNDIRLTLFNEIKALNVTQNTIDFQTLLSGGNGPYKLRIRILNLFMLFIKNSKRFET